ncbi:MAG: radical SAM protein [Candidatus Magasanikbacteria bacterium]|nr:radical SAM protein [Candidatus Magasanikbacteria bacterium]
MVMFNVAKSIVKNKFNKISYPSFITYLITWRCNSRCIFCDVWKKRAGQIDELDIDEIEKAFSQLKKLDVLRLSGGEPFLRKDLAEVINLIDKINKPSLIHLTSNGMLTEIISETVKKIKPLNKIHIKISIDNVGEKHDKVRQIPGAYNKAMETVRMLSNVSKETGLHVGVNQVVVNESDIDSYFELKKILSEYNVPIYPVIANQPTNSLYSDSGVVDPNISFKPFGDFSKEGIKKFMKILLRHGKEVNDFKEQMVDRYHLKGLYNRLVEEKNNPNPKCVALNNHLRILPNGDIPVCMYNGSIVGNLRNEKFKDIWFGDKIKKYRTYVNNCPGCWQSCETAVSAIYTGDIMKGMFY